jgi:hypothetical protein
MENSLTKLSAALSAFQAEHHAAGRDSKGNYGTYTSLAGALAAVQPACSHGLSHSQTLHPLGEDMVVLRTTLFHNSGESLYSDLPIPLKTEGGRGNYWQAMGSALTYARRYCVLAIYGLASDDDEGESAPQPAPRAAQSAPKAAPKSSKPAPAAPIPAKAEDAPAKVDGPNQIEWIDPERRKQIVAALRAAKDKDFILEAFRAEFKIATPKVTPEQIQLPAHGDFLEQRLGLLAVA